MIFDVSEIEERIGYTFKDKMLLRKCFTHSSYANEHGEESNERLEFFGDAVIKFIDSEFLYKNAKGDEGHLTEDRKGIESNKALLKSAKKLGLSEFVLLGNGQSKTVSKDDKIFSSAYEALVAGIYLDGGLAAAKKFVTATVLSEFTREKKEKEKSASEDFKSALQEFVQKRKIGSISYETLSKIGPDHMPEFRVALLINGKPLAEGKGASKKEAEAKAAEKGLKKLKD